MPAKLTSVGMALAVTGVVGALAASFLPWAQSGSSGRNSYGLVAAARRLDVVSGTAAGLARGWYLVPLLAACAWVAAALRRPLVVAILSAVVGSATLALFAAVKASPLPVDIGAYLALAAGVLALLGAARLAWEQRSRP